MQRLFSFLVLPLFVLSAFAVDNPYSLPPDASYISPPLSSWYDLPALDQPVLQLPDNALITTYQQDDIQVLSTVEPVTPANATGLKKILLELIGNYESIVTDYRYQNSNGTWSYLREIQPDYVWLASAVVFAIVLWCTFRAGVSICKR